MARRVRKTAWSTLLRRGFELTRAGVRAGTRMVRSATKTAKVGVAKSRTTKSRPTKSRTPKPRTTKPRAAKNALAPGSEAWSLGVATGPAGARRYRLFKPAGSAGSRYPLLVLLHGCGQDAEGFAQSTQLQRLVAREGVALLLPEQDRLANAQGCWNWFATRTGNAYSEAASIIAAIDQACLDPELDGASVSVAGFSAGASMAALLALRYPARFRAVAMHSGVAPGAAYSSASAISAMQGRRSTSPLSLADDAATLPALLVIQGTADPVVRSSNGRGAAQAWADALGARVLPARTVRRGKRYASRITDFKQGGRVRVSLCEISGLAHAWSGGAAKQRFSDARGPDASRMILSFVARHSREPSTGSRSQVRTQLVAKQ